MFFQTLIVRTDISINALIDYKSNLNIIIYVWTSNVVEHIILKTLSDFLITTRY